MNRETMFPSGLRSDATSNLNSAMPANGSANRRRSTLTHNDIDMLFSVFAPSQPVKAAELNKIPPPSMLLTTPIVSVPFSATAKQNDHAGATKIQARRRSTLTHGDVEMLFAMFSSEGSCGDWGHYKYPHESAPVQKANSSSSRRLSLQNNLVLDSLVPSHVSRICEDLNKSAKSRKANATASKHASSSMPHGCNKRKHDLVSSGCGANVTDQRRITGQKIQLDTFMEKSETTQMLLRDWDKRMGLKHSHFTTKNQESQESRKKLKQLLLETNLLSQRSATDD